MPARTIGCENASGRPGSRISAPARMSAADAASSSSRLASLAACRRSPHSKIATARARRPAGSGSRSSRSKIDLPTVRAPIRSTCAAYASLGATPSARSAPTSSRIRNGVPPVACRHASTNPGSGDAPNPSVTNCATAVRVNGARWSTSAEGSVASAASSPASAPASRGRVAAITAIDSPSSLVSRNERNRKEGESAHCASSRAMHTGSEELTLAHSQ